MAGPPHHPFDSLEYDADSPRVAGRSSAQTTCSPIGASTIARRRFIKPVEDPKAKRLRINERIRISPIRLIDEENNQIGVIEVDEALRRAKAAELDLVEVAPSSSPPVCRIMDYGKWMYQQKKKEQKAKSHSKQSELKEMRLRPGTDAHDLKIKNDRAREFLSAGDRVQFTILFKGRQMAHREIGFKLFDQIIESFMDIAHVEMTPRIQGRRMTMTLAHGVKVAKAPPAPKGPLAPKPAAASADTGDAAPPTSPPPAPSPPSEPTPSTPS